MEVWVLVDEERPVAVTRNQDVAKRFYSIHSKTGDIYPFQLDDMTSADMNLPQGAMAPDPVDQTMAENGRRINDLFEKHVRKSSLLQPRPGNVFVSHFDREFLV